MNILTQSILRTLVAPVILCAALIGCDKDPASKQSPDEAKIKTTTTAIQSSEGSSSDKISATNNNMVRILTKLPAFQLTNQSGNKISLEDLYGQVWVANFIFTECKGSCPLQTKQMRTLQKHINQNPQIKSKKINLVSFTVDPTTDTPEKLTNYINEHSLDTRNWHFLTGSRTEIWNLSKSGFMLPVTDDAKSSEMPIMHSSQFVVVDWEGRIRGYYDGLKESGMADLKRDLAKVINEQVPHPADVINPAWVQNRMSNQIKASSDYGVFHSFKFSDEIKTSGISFKHIIVDDAASEYKAVHYDHGNGVAVADVDMDGLHDIYFTTQVGTNQLWRNVGNGKFEDITEKSGLMVDDRIGVAAAFADIDNDGDPDLYTTSVRIGNQLFENDGKGNFKDITKQSGTGIQAHSSGAVFFDYDRDGLLDLFVSNVGVYTTDTQANVTVYTDRGQKVSDYKYYVGFKDAFAGHLKPERAERSVLFKNMGNNKFEDVSEKTGLVDTSWTGAATPIDGNNDGWPDLYVISMQGHDEYYENVEGKSFVRKSREFFEKTSWGAMGIKSFDFDNDGDMDIFVTDMHSDMSEEILGSKEKLKASKTYPESFLMSGGKSLFGNTFFKNEGNGKFSEISDEINAENYWPWGLSTGDFNADGFEDAFLALSMNFPFRYSPNALLLNDNGKGFLDSEYVLGVEPRRRGLTAAPLFELNCSGSDRGKKICGTAKGRRIVWGALGTRSSVIFDLDEDGDLDIVTLEFNQKPMVLISDLNERKNINFLKVKLVGSKTNKSGIGTTVRIHSGNDIYTKVQDGNSGYLAQSIYPLYFGLGDHKRIDKIEVNWTSGHKQIVEGPITINRLLSIVEQ